VPLVYISCRVWLPGTLCTVYFLSTVLTVWTESSGPITVNCCFMYLPFRSMFLFIRCKVMFYPLPVGTNTGSVLLLMELHPTTMECHTVLPATWHKWTHPALTPARQAGTRFTYLGWMEGWVDLGDLLHTEMVYPPADGQPIQVLTKPSVD